MIAKTATAGLVLAAGLCAPVWAQQGGEQEGNKGAAPQTPSEPTGRRSSLVQRSYISRIMPALPLGQPNGPGVDDPAIFPDEFRRIDGRFNNLTAPWWGAAGIPFIRKTPAAYDDGTGLIPARSNAPSARAVSQAIVDQDEQDMPSDAGISNMFWLWGQFLDHDIDETPVAVPTEPFDVEAPLGDPWFDPMSLGGMRIALDRSGYEVVAGTREQVNFITAYIDASNVYGSDAAREAELRLLDGSGKLNTSDGDMLPFNINGFPNAPNRFNPRLYLAGDVRCNEQVSLIAMHTLWVREHNHWADEVLAANPGFSGDEVYEYAKAIVTGIIQSITYNEFLPILLGPDALEPYTGYDSTIDAGIANEFAAAGFRMGHTMLPLFLSRLDSQGNEAPEGHLSLAQAFFEPEEIGDNGIDSVLRGVSMTPAQQFDTMLVGEVRNFLFGMPGYGGFDLASLNIQRGRDHGLPDYNTVRDSYGMGRVADFDEINPDPEVWQRFASVYDDCEGIDPWVGILGEPAYNGGLAGETLSKILIDQFTRLRDGDRFWYESYLPADMVDLVEQQTFETVLKRNTFIGDEVGESPFLAPVGCPVDLDGDGALTIFDFLAFQTLFGQGDLRADFDGDGALTIFDFLTFQNAFDAGCD